MQHLVETVVLILELQEVVEVGPVRLAALLDVLVTSQQVDGRVTVEVKLRAVVNTKSWEASQWGPWIFCLIEMCRIRRTFLKSKQN